MLAWVNLKKKEHENSWCGRIKEEDLWIVEAQDTAGTFCSREGN